MKVFQQDIFKYKNFNSEVFSNCGTQFTEIFFVKHILGSNLPKFYCTAAGFIKGEKLLNQVQFMTMLPLKCLLLSFSIRTLTICDDLSFEKLE